MAKTKAQAYKNEKDNKKRNQSFGRQFRQNIRRTFGISSSKRNSSERRSIDGDNSPDVEDGLSVRSINHSQRLRRQVARDSRFFSVKGTHIVNLAARGLKNFINVDKEV